MNFKQGILEIMMQSWQPWYVPGAADSVLTQHALVHFGWAADDVRVLEMRCITRTDEHCTGYQLSDYLFFHLRYNMLVGIDVSSGFPASNWVARFRVFLTRYIVLSS